MAKQGDTIRRDDAIINLVGHNIKKYRKLHKLTIEQLAFKMNVDYKQLWNLEHGAVDTNLTMLNLVATTLNIDICKLFDANSPNLK